MKKAGLIFVFLIILILSFSLVISDSNSEINSKSELKVTSEHPFFVNNSWIEAKDLKIGDELKTYDGKKAVITNIQDIISDEPFLVYNLEDSNFHNYVADSVIVHNSNSPIQLIRGHLISDKGTRIISPKEIENWYESQRLFWDLLRNYPNAASIEGGADKVVYVIDLSKINTNDVPVILREFPRKIIVVKILEGLGGTPISEGCEPEANFEVEVVTMDRVNEFFSSRGKELFYPEKTYLVGYKQVSQGYRVIEKGVLVQDAIEETKLSYILAYLKNHNTLPRARQLYFHIRSKSPEIDNMLYDAFVEKKIFLDDMWDSNLAMGFKYQNTKLTYQEILSSDIDINAIEVYLKGYEAGQAVIDALAPGYEPRFPSIFAYYDEYF